MLVIEAIDIAIELGFRCDEKHNIVMRKFKELLKISCNDIALMCSEKAYTQIDGFSIGNKVAPMMANIWLPKFDDVVKDDSEV